MILTNAQVAGFAVALLGFVFAGAYAVASHHPERPVQRPTPSSQVEQVHQVQVLDRSVPEAGVVFKSNTNAPEEHPATF